jgi:outer membrane protein assembly factor BamB
VVYCLDAKSGETLWTHAYPARLSPNSYEGGPSATPTIADGNVYTLSKEGMAYCLDANDGAVLWQNDLVANYGVSAPTWGFAGSPYVDANLVIYNAGTHGLALHAADGTLAWETGTNTSGYSTPVPFDFGQQRLLVLMGEKTFAAVQAQTGQVLWESPWVTRHNANIPDPIVDSNLVFVSTGYQEGSALFDVATGQVTQLWFQKNMQTFLNSSVLWQGYLYGLNDSPNYNRDALTCVQRSTGRIVWSELGFGNGSVTLADGKLIILSQAGQLCIAEASPAGYREKGRGRILTGKCWSVPVLANGKIYARNATGTLVCVELETTGPRVDAGSSIITWLEAGTATVDLSGAVADDTGDVTTILWSVISSPLGSTVDIANDSAATTTATFAETGSYVLELYAIDATAQEGSDRMQVSVYADSCEAARNNPISAYVAPLYDFNDDCRVDFKDFAVFAAEPLEIENFNDFAVFAAGWLETENFNDFAVFAAGWLEIENFNDLAVFAAEWLEDESLTADVLYDAGRITLPAVQSTNPLESNRRKNP